MMMMTASQYAAKYGISKQWACNLAKAGLIAGCQLVGRTWVIPDDAPEPPKLPKGKAASPNGSRSVRMREAAARRARAETERVLLDAGIAKVPDLSEREIWWKETLDAGGVPIGGHRWVELEGDIEFVGWAANETEAEFRAREVAWNRWKQAGQPDEGMPEDFRRFCESASSDG